MQQLVEGHLLRHVDEQVLGLLLEVDALNWYDALCLALDGHEALDLLPNLLDLVRLDAVEGDDADQEALRLVRSALNLIIYLVVFFFLVVVGALRKDFVDEAEFLVLELVWVRTAVV